MNNLINQTIKAVRPMTKKEIESEGWYGGTTVLVLSNGVKLYASQDEEGNGPGCIFGCDGKKQFGLS